MKCAYELRQVDALWYGDHWVWNESYHIEDVELENGTEEEFLLEQIVPECRKDFAVEYDANGDVFELLDKTEENRPAMALVLMAAPLPF